MSREQELLEESVKLELNVGEIYEMFSGFFEDDRDFWQQLGREEANHAQLLRAGMEMFSASMFPDELLFARLADLRKINGQLGKLKEEYKVKLPTPQDALRLALTLEDSAGEAHYQLVMEGAADSEAARLFKQLNEDDKDHSRRIRIYAERHGYDIF